MLAAAGVASRRASEDLIFSGAVTVNGNRCLLPQTMVHPVQDQARISELCALPLPPHQSADPNPMESGGAYSCLPDQLQLARVTGNVRLKLEE